MSRPLLPGEMPLAKLRESGVLQEVNRLLLHRAGYRLVVALPTEDMNEEAADQGWPAPEPSLAILDCVGLPEDNDLSGPIYEEEALLARLPEAGLAIENFKKRLVQRAGNRAKKYKWEKQPLPGNNTL